MPILPQNKHLYPKNWKEISRNIRFIRAKNKCEFCGVDNYSVVCRKEDRCLTIYRPKELIENDKDAKIAYQEAIVMQNALAGAKSTIIVLTVAHLDHDPTNNNPDNLKALCQRCHNRYDRNHRNETRKNNVPRRSDC